MLYMCAVAMLAQLGFMSCCTAGGGVGLVSVCVTMLPYKHTSLSTWKLLRCRWRRVCVKRRPTWW